VTRSLPHLENQHQWSINNIWSCIWGDASSALLQTSINMELEAVVGRNPRDIPRTPSWTVTTYFTYIAATNCSLAFWPIGMVKTSSLHKDSHILQGLTMIQGQMSLMHWWRSGLADCSSVVTCISAQIGGNYIHYVLQQQSIVSIIWLTRPTIVENLLTLIYRLWLGACHFLFCQ